MTHESRLLLSALFLGAFFTGCGPDAQPPAQAVPKVTTAAAVAQETVDYNDFTGTVKASETVEVRSRVYGYLLDIAFDDGDFVEKDHELFKIEPDQYQAVHDQSVSKIAIVEAELKLANAKHARNTILLEKKAVSQEDFDETAAMVQVSKAKLVAAQADEARTGLDLKYTTIIAPISGRIDRTQVSRGNFVMSGETGGTLLTTIVKEQPAYVYFDVDEATMLRYRNYRRAKDAGDKKIEQEEEKRPGSLVEFKIPCYVEVGEEKDFPHAGWLDFAANQSDAGTGTIKIRGKFLNKDRVLTSGLYVRVRVPTSDPYEAVMIPESAIALDQSQRYVWVVGDDGVAKRRDVELGSRRGDWRIVKKNLTAGEKVIIKGVQRVKPDKPVDAAELKDLSPPKMKALPPPEEQPEVKPAEEKSEAKPADNQAKLVPVVPAPANAPAPNSATEGK